jgi:hypothetical protein
MIESGLIDAGSRHFVYAERGALRAPGDTTQQRPRRGLQRDAFQGVREGAEASVRRRAAVFDGLIGAARLLAGMIEKMGGTATSMPRGTYVNLTV